MQVHLSPIKEELITGRLNTTKSILISISPKVIKPWNGYLFYPGQVPKENYLMTATGGSGLPQAFCPQIKISFSLVGYNYTALGDKLTK